MRRRNQYQAHRIRQGTNRSTAPRRLRREASRGDHKPTVVTIEFHDRGTGTELVLTHRRLVPKVVEGHRKGWTDILRLLDEGLTRG